MVDGINIRGLMESKSVDPITNTLPAFPHPQLVSFSVPNDGLKHGCPGLVGACMPMTQVVERSPVGIGNCLLRLLQA
jgi:hypothetical protein